MKIAITGGAGFIASTLAQGLIEAGHELVLIDLKPSSQYPAMSRIVDIRDREALIAACSGCDALYHLAAEHRDDVQPIQKYYDVNVEGGQNVIAAANAHNIRHVIFTSSVAVYGLDAGESRETDTPAPFNDYGRSKHESEKTFLDWAAETPQAHLSIVRLVATFGPGNRGNIYTLMRQIAAGRFLMVGNGANCKSIAYVKNVAAFLQHLLTQQAKQPPGTALYNYADKPDLDMRQFVLDVRAALGRTGMGLQIPYALGLLAGYGFDLLTALSGRSFPISTVRVRKFCANTIVNADAARASGFTAPFSLREGLKDMIEAEFKTPPPANAARPPQLRQAGHG